jgi:hypothetical protein
MSEGSVNSENEESQYELQTERVKTVDFDHSDTSSMFKTMSVLADSK